MTTTIPSSDKLLAQHLEAIEKNCFTKVGTHVAASSCASITVEHMAGFAEWKDKYYWVSYKDVVPFYWERIFSPTFRDGTRYTTSELVALYLQAIK